MASPGRGKVDVDLRSLGWQWSLQIGLVEYQATLHLSSSKCALIPSPGLLWRSPVVSQLKSVVGLEAILVAPAASLSSVASRGICQLRTRRLFYMGRSDTTWRADVSLSWSCWLIRGVVSGRTKGGIALRGQVGGPAWVDQLSGSLHLDQHNSCKTSPYYHIIFSTYTAQTGVSHRFLKAEIIRRAWRLDLDKTPISPMLNLKKCQSSTVQPGSFWNYGDIMFYVYTPDKGPSFFKFHYRKENISIWNMQNCVFAYFIVLNCW